MLWHLGHADCMFMDLNMTQVELDALPSVVSVSKDVGMNLAAASQQNATVALWLPYYSSFDLNVVLLWIMAVGTFVVAGIWAGHDSIGDEHAYLKAEGSQEVCCWPFTCPVSLQHISVASMSKTHQQSTEPRKQYSAFTYLLWCMYAMTGLALTPELCLLIITRAFA